MIQLSGIKKSFHDLEILKSVDLTIEKGEVVVILGPSGSGKPRCCEASTALTGQMTER